MRRSGEWPATAGRRVTHHGGQASGETPPQPNRHSRESSSKNHASLLTYSSKPGTYDSVLTAQMCAVILVIVALGGCGYHIAGKSDSLPKSIHVIAVPAMENKTASYRIEQRLTSATVHEFLAKTSYRVVSDPANADAVLRGKVLSLEAVPLLFDTKTGRATAMLVTVKCEITFEERESGKILYHTDNFLFRNQYEISVNVNNPTDPRSVGNFFDEQDPALERLARDFATRLVAAVVENY